MTSVPDSSTGVTSLSKQRTDVIQNNGNADKIKKLKQMIEELEKAKKEYLKANLQLTQNTKLVYLQNKILKDTICDRTVAYEHILDKYSRSTRTLQTATDNNKKMSKIYQRYKTKVSNTQKNSNDSVFSEKIEKIDKDLKNIQKSSNELIKNFYESEKKMFDYKVLLSLDSKLISINKFFTKEAKNCILFNPCFFSNSRLGKLQQKIIKGEEIKRELSLFDSEEEKEKLEATENALKTISDKNDCCLSIYNQILLINKKRTLMSEDDLDDDFSSDKSRLSFCSSSLSNRSEKKCGFTYEKVESRYPKKANLDAEIFELKRIVENSGFDYLNDPEREENNRKIQSLFVPGLNNRICMYDESTESSESEDDDNDESGFLDSSDESESEIEEPSIVEQPVKSSKQIQSEKVNKSQLVKESSSRKTKQPEKPNKSKQSKEADKMTRSGKLNKSELATREGSSNKLKQPEKQSQRTNKLKQSKDADKISNSEKLNRSELANESNLCRPKHHEKLKKSKEADKISKSDKLNRSESEKESNSRKPKQQQKQSESLNQPKQSLEADKLTKSDKLNRSELEKESNSNKSKQSENLHQPKQSLETDKLSKSDKLNRSESEKESNSRKPKQQQKQSENLNQPKHSLETDKLTKSDKLTDINLKKESNSNKLKQPKVGTVDSSLKHLEKVNNSDKNEKISHLEKVNKPEKEEKIDNPSSNISEKKSNFSKGKEEPPPTLLDHQRLLERTEKVDNSKHSEKAEHTHLHHSHKSKSLDQPKKKNTQEEEKVTNTDKMIQPKQQEITKNSQFPVTSRMQTEKVHHIKNSEEDHEIKSKPNKLEIPTHQNLNQSHTSKQSSPEQQETNCNQKISDESESILLELNEKSEQITQSDQKEASKPCSLLVHSANTQKLSDTKCNRKNSNSSSDFLLKDHQKITQNANKSSSLSIKAPSSLSLNPNKSRQQSFKKLNKKIDNTTKDSQPDKSNVTENSQKLQKSTEKSEISFEHTIEDQERQSEASFLSDCLEIASSSEVFFDSSCSIPYSKSEDQPKPLIKAPLSLLIHPNKSRRKSFTKSLNQSNDNDSEKSTEFIIDDFEDHHFLSDRMISTDKFNQTNESIESLIHLKTPHLRKFEHSSEFMPEELEEQLEEELEKEKISIQLSLLELCTSSSEIEKVEPPKITVKKPCSLLVRPNKSRHQISHSFTKKSDESDCALEFILEVPREEDNQLEDNSNQAKKTEEKIEPLIQPKNHPYSLLVHPINKRRKNSISFLYQKVSDEDDCDAEFVLKIPDSDSEKPNNKENEIQETQIETKNQISDSHPPLKKRILQKKKKNHVSTYDPSVFYSPATIVSRCNLDFHRSDDKIPLTVSLKDIGLEGLDSCKMEKMKELQRTQQLKKEEKKKTESKVVVCVSAKDKKQDKSYPLPSTEVVCKLNINEKAKNEKMKKVDQIEPYIAYKDSSSNDKRKSGLNQIPASLLDSTQKAQKIQAIKPKMPSKTGHKVSKSKSACKDENQWNSIVCRSPRRYTKENSDSDENKDLVFC